MTTLDYKLLDTVVLARSLPDHGLIEGDLGTVVELYPPDGLEVENRGFGGLLRAARGLFGIDEAVAGAALGHDVARTTGSNAAKRRIPGHR